MSRILFPSTCNPEKIFDLCNEIEKHSKQHKINIDFSNMGRIEPFAMVYVAKHIRDFHRKQKRNIDGFKIFVVDTKVKIMLRIWLSLGLSD